MKENSEDDLLQKVIEKRLRQPLHAKLFNLKKLSEVR